MQRACRCWRGPTVCGTDSPPRSRGDPRVPCLLGLSHVTCEWTYSQYKVYWTVQRGVAARIRVSVREGCVRSPLAACPRSYRRAQLRSPPRRYEPTATASEHLGRKTGFGSGDRVGHDHHACLQQLSR